MMKTLLNLAFLFLPLLPAAAEPPDRLYGTWRAESVSTPLGSVDIRLTFSRQNDADITDWSTLPLVGEVRDTEGEFSVENGKIISKAIHGGTTVEYWFENGKLVIRCQDGKTVRFTREDG